MNIVFVFGILVCLVTSESLKPVSKVLTPPKYDIDGRISCTI